MLLPSGVSSDHRGQRRQPPKFALGVVLPTGMNSVACRLPIVIVPVLSSSTMSMSPAVSTALPLLAMMLALQRAVHSGDADRGQQRADRGRESDRPAAPPASARRCPGYAAVRSGPDSSSCIARR